MMERLHEHEVSELPSELETLEAPGPSPEELESNPELGRLYRSLDQDDRPWMEQLGCEWPDEEHEKEWLAAQNNLVSIGGETLATHPDEHAQIVYAAREEFLEGFPVVKEAYRRLGIYRDAYIKEHPEYGEQRIIPLRTLISGQRALHGYGLHVGKVVAVSPVTTYISGSAILERVNNFGMHGIDQGRLLVNSGNSPRWLSLNSNSVSRKLGVMYGIARAWGISNNHEEVNRLVVASPDILGRSSYSLLALGRLSVVLFGKGEQSELPVQDVRQVVIAPIMPIIAAYLARRNVISTPQGLTYQGRRLDAGYSRDELLGYIVGFPDDPVVKTYLRGHPIREEEIERLPKLRELPHREPSAWRAGEDWQSPGAQRARVQASGHRQTLRHLLDMPPATQKEHHTWLDDIGLGLEVEESGKPPTDYTQDEIGIVADGQVARKQLHASFAAKVLELRYPSSGRLMINQGSEESLQNGMLKLMIAILNLARRHSEDRPDDVWPFIENQMRTIELEFFGDDDGASETTNGHATDEQLAALVGRYSNR